MTQLKEGSYPLIPLKPLMRVDIPQPRSCFSHREFREKFGIEAVILVFDNAHERQLAQQIICDVRRNAPDRYPPFFHWLGQEAETLN